MRRLQTRCHTCGEVTLTANDFIVSATTCWFRCPGCGVDVAQSCDPETGRLLLMNGASRRPERTRMGTSDLTALRELLERPDFIDLIRQHH